MLNFNFVFRKILLLSMLLILFSACYKTTNEHIEGMVMETKSSNKDTTIKFGDGRSIKFINDIPIPVTDKTCKFYYERVLPRYESISFPENTVTYVECK